MGNALRDYYFLEAEIHEILSQPKGNHEGRLGIQRCSQRLLLKISEIIPHYPPPRDNVRRSRGSNSNVHLLFLVQRSDPRHRRLYFSRRLRRRCMLGMQREHKGNTQELTLMKEKECRRGKQKKCKWGAKGIQREYLKCKRDSKGTRREMPRDGTGCAKGMQSEY